MAVTVDKKLDNDDLLALAKTQRFEFGNNSGDRAEFRSFPDGERVLTLMVKGNNSYLQLEDGGTQAITSKEAQALISPEARREWRESSYEAGSQFDHKKGGIMPEKDERITLDPSTLRMEREAIVSVANAKAAVSQPELARETQSYYNGRAAGFNDVLLAVKEQNPGREKDLPTPILMDEIRVRSMQQDQEQGKDKSLVIAR